MPLLAPVDGDGDITIDMIDTTRDEGHEGMMSEREEGG